MSDNAELYPRVDSWFDLPAVEREILDLWRANSVFDKLRAKNEGGESWSFFDGPITANNPMGVHHAWGRSLKDVYNRYWAMNGRKLRYQNGFDCQGLWVEVEVEKQHGFESKRDIEDYGIDRFVRDCKERVLTYAARQTEQSIRLGYWMDWDDPDLLLSLRDAMKEGKDSVTVTATNGQTLEGDPELLVGKLGTPEMGGSYFTFSTVNNYTIWSFLRKCHDEGHIYRGTDVMPWCCRCGTGLSQMEVAEGRKITEHTSVFVRFPLHGRDNEALLVWTTTPWTLTSNVAAAVNPEMTYLKVRHGDWILYVGKGNFENARVQSLEAAGQKRTEKLQGVNTMLKGSAELEVLGELKGAELVGLTYDGPFDHLPVQDRPGGLDPFGTETSELTARQCHRVLAWDMVSEAEGTGIVHIAPGCGAEDAALGKVEGIIGIAPLSETGEYLDGFDWLSGRHVLGVADDIVTDLKDRGVLVAKESYPHVYPHCWRCKQELVFRLVDEWFISMDWRDRIAKTVGDIQWIPPDGEARELDWLKNMGDWMISKKRFWGLALPIWVCRDCNGFEVIGAEAELKERATEGWETFAGHTPHRPWIDAVKIACSDCGGTMDRVHDVGNPWLDAGIIPYSTVGYTTDRDYWETWFPAELVLESFPGQFRNWFYALLAMSAMMENRAPFKTLLGHGLVRDQDGDEMHKSKGNAIWFDDAAEEYGADVMRWLYAQQDPSRNVNFGPRPLKEIRGSFFNQLWNTQAFFLNYARIEGFVPSETRTPFSERTDFDRWILTELADLVSRSRELMQAYQHHQVVRYTEEFLESLSNWYVRHNRRRFWKTDETEHTRAAFETLYECLETLTRLIAPIVPFMAERLYQNLVVSAQPEAVESVHLCEYPQPLSDRDDELAEQMRAIIRLRTLALAARGAAKIKTRQPLAKLTVGPRTKVEKAAAERFVDMLRDDVNVKEVEVLDLGAESPLRYTVKPDFKALGKKLGKLMGPVAKALAQAPASAVVDPLNAGAEEVTLDVDGTPVTLLRDELILHPEQPEGLSVTEDRNAWCGLDVVITDALALEGLMRDLQRRLQVMRKDSGFEIDDRIRIEWSSDDDTVTRVFETFGSDLASELLAVTVERVDSVEGETVKLGDATLSVRLERV